MKTGTHDLPLSKQARSQLYQEALAEARKRAAESQAREWARKQANIQTEDELRQYIKFHFNSTIPDVQICAHHTTPWRAFADAFFANYPVTVIKASRGFGGKSYLLALLGLVEASALGADISILGGSGAQSRRVHQHANTFWTYPNSPRSMLAKEPTNIMTSFIGGNTIVALTASQTSVRGPHPQRLRMDEIDEMDLEILDAALGQPMGSKNIPAQTVLSSTHQYADGTMTKIIARAEEKNWPIYEWCYQETMQGWLSEDEIARKRTEVTDEMWKVEYDLQEPSPESRAINQAGIKIMFDKDLGEYPGTPRAELVFEEFKRDGIYVTAADWAKKQDWTVIVTLRVDVKPMKVVAFLRTQREPWPVMVGNFNQRIEDYSKTADASFYTIHDGTGIGDVVEDYIEHESEPFIMAGRPRTDLLTEYINAVEKGEIKSPWIAWMRNEHRLASVDDVYGTKHLPDSIAAMALAYRGAKTIMDMADWGGHENLGTVEDYQSPYR